MKEKKEVFIVPDGDADCWAEQASSVMLKAVTHADDPGEPTKDEAVAPAQAWLKWAAQIS